MSTRNERYQEKWKASLEGKVPGEVLAVGLFSRPGSMGNMVASMVSPLAGMLGNHGSKKRAGGLPQNVVLAITADEVHVFPYKGTATGGIKVKQPVVVWPRSAVHLAHAGSGAMTDTFHVEIAGQEPIQLDSYKMPGSSSDFNEPVFALLRRS